MVHHICISSLWANYKTKVYFYFLQAEEEDNDRQTAFAPLTIDIEDVNDECPIVVASSVKGVFVEGEPYVSDVDRQNWLTIRINDNDTELVSIMDVFKKLPSFFWYSKHVLHYEYRWCIFYVWYMFCNI